MSVGDPVIILSRREGPVHGLTIVVVDAPGFTQAEFVVNTNILGSPLEQATLRRMLDERGNSIEAIKEVDL